MARKPSPRRPAPEPLEIDAVNVAIIGTTLWALAGIMLTLLGRDWLAKHDSTWWLWTCLAGVGLGFMAIFYTARRRSRLRRNRL